MRSELQCSVAAATGDKSEIMAAQKRMEIAADMCVYTNKNFVIETIPQGEPEEDDTEKEDKEEDRKNI